MKTMQPKSVALRELRPELTQMFTPSGLCKVSFLVFHGMQSSHIIFEFEKNISTCVNI